MTLVPLHTKETSPEQSKPILERYEKNIGMIPNLFRLLAHSPDALKGVADLHAGLGRSLGARTREPTPKPMRPCSLPTRCQVAWPYRGCGFRGGASGRLHRRSD